MAYRLAMVAKEQIELGEDSVGLSPTSSPLLSSWGSASKHSN